MRILIGSSEHVEGCLAVARELVGEYFTPESIVAIQKALQEDAVYLAAVYMAIEDADVVGFASVRRANEDVAELSWISVKRERQRQGIGSALVERVADDLRAQGVRLLKVKTLSERCEYPPYENTRRFYRKMGFLLLETIEPYPGWDGPCAIYVKVL